MNKHTIRGLKLIAVLGLVTVVAAGIETTATAGDNKVYPGVSCWVLPTEPNVAYGYEGKIENTHSTSSVVVECPIVRDNVTTPWNSLKMRVRDDHNEKEVSCLAMSCNTIGESCFTESKGTGTGYSSSSYIEMSSFSSLSETDYGTMLVECVIPSQQANHYRNGIAGYHIDES